MEFKNQLKRIKRKLTILTDRDKEKFLFHPHRDWFLLVSSFSFFGVVLVSVGFFLFLQISSGDLFIVVKDDNKASKTIDQIKLGQVLELNEGKEKQLQNLLLKQPKIIDPSL